MLPSILTNTEDFQKGELFYVKEDYLKLYGFLRAYSGFVVKSIHGDAIESFTTGDRQDIYTFLKRI